MRAFFQFVVLTGLMLLMGSSSADAEGFGFFRPAYSGYRYSQSYYYPPVVVSRPVYTYYAAPAWTPATTYCVSPSPLPSTSLRPLAEQTPAPPSPEPIRSMPMKPTVTESRSMNYLSQFSPSQETPRLDRYRYDTYYLGQSNKPVASSSATDLFSVAFWNLTEGPISLRVNGRDYTLEPGRRITLDLPKQFVWRVGTQEAVTSQLDGERRGAEIVIRRSAENVSSR